MSRPIPETGQEVEIVRLHPIDWRGAVRFITELQAILATRTLIINDAFSMPLNVLIDTMVSWVRNWIVSTHFNHYQRCGFNLGAYTPAKGKAMLCEEVPEVFVHLARHLGRPRILIDGSVSLPIPDAPLCDGVRYAFGGNAPAAVTVNTVLRNLIIAGPPMLVLQGIQIAGSPIIYRSRCFTSLRRDFAGMQTYRNVGLEGLVPARICYWSERTDQFIHFLDLSDAFDNAIFEIDCILTPLIMPDMAAVPLPARPANGVPAIDANAQQVFYDAILAHFTSERPPAIQWMANDVLIGTQGIFTRTMFLEREASAYHVNPTRTQDFCRTEFLSKVGSDFSQLQFPSLGITRGGETLRQLANDLGSAHPTSNRSNAKRDDKRTQNRSNRQDRGARTTLDTQYKTEDQTDDGPATSEEKKSVQDRSDQDSLQSDRANQATTNSRRRRKGGKGGKGAQT
jgi:hypothetical protein